MLWRVFIYELDWNLWLLLLCLVQKGYRMKRVRLFDGKSFISYDKILFLFLCLMFYWCWRKKGFFLAVDRLRGMMHVLREAAKNNGLFLVARLNRGTQNYFVIKNSRFDGAAMPSLYKRGPSSCNKQETHTFSISWFNGRLILRVKLGIRPLQGIWTSQTKNTSKEKTMGDSKQFYLSN